MVTNITDRYLLLTDIMNDLLYFGTDSTPETPHPYK